MIYQNNKYLTQDLNGKYNPDYYGQDQQAFPILFCLKIYLQHTESNSITDFP